MVIGICEDNKGVREVIKLLLEEYAKNKGREIDVRNYANSKPENDLDILILNVVKPKIDGIALGKEVRRKNKKLKLFYITASAERVLKDAGLTEYAYLRKPFSIDDFCTIIDELIREVGV